MIRKKKNEDDIPMTPLSDIDDAMSLEDDSEENSQDKPKKKAFRMPWGKKKEKEEGKNESMVSQDKPDDFDPLNLQEDGVEYLKIEDDKKISKKKIVLIVGGILFVLGLAIFLVVKNINGSDSGKVYVQSVSVLAGLGTANGGSNRYTGVVEAQDSWKITLDADMSVSKCYVKVGDEVKKGDKLFEYNTEELKLNQEKKELELETLQNEINQLNRDIQTYNSDLNGASSTEKIELQTQILTAQTTIKKNEFSIKSAKDEIEKIKKTIKDATVKSKMDGVIKNINAALGNSSSDDEAGYSEGFSNGNTDDANVYMTVLAIGDYRIKGTINETNAPSIAEGTAVIVRSRIDDQTWTGTISTKKTETTANEEQSQGEEFNEEGNSMESATNYNFYVTLDSDDGLMMGQHVFIEPDNGQDEEKEGYWIASAYILVEEDNYYVWADNGKGRLQKRKIEVGEYDEELDEYQVTKGINENDYIACDDMDLRDGMKTTTVDPYTEEGLDEDDDSEVTNDLYGDEMEEDFDEGDFDENLGDESFNDEEYFDEESDQGDYEELP
ncbi:MAG: biotin/lipoyl-binding protein [Eubacteriales bacterium]|nr:biotin/lipoyl-binding protein [Eubacteriales bacterium]